MRKGTTRHRIVGGCYAGALLMVNLGALTLSGGSGRFGPFQVLAIISLSTLLAGLVPMRLLPRTTGGIAAHGITMGFSYVGLVAAGLSQVAAQSFPHHTGMAVLAASLATFAVGAVAIFGSIDRAMRRSGIRA